MKPILFKCPVCTELIKPSELKTENGVTLCISCDAPKVKELKQNSIGTIYNNAKTDLNA